VIIMPTRVIGEFKINELVKPETVELEEVAQ
jgi:hypothetical protein